MGEDYRIEVADFTTVEAQISNLEVEIDSLKAPGSNRAELRNKGILIVQKIEALLKLIEDHVLQIGVDRATELAGRVTALQGKMRQVLLDILKSQSV